MKVNLALLAAIALSASIFVPVSHSQAKTITLKTCAKYVNFKCVEWKETVIKDNGPSPTIQG